MPATPGNQLLIVGKKPPPIGGVTNHVMRLCQHLSIHGFEFDFFELKNFSFIKLLHQIRIHKAIHFHMTHSIGRFLFIGCAKLLGKNTLVTFHGNLGRYSFGRNFLDLLSIILVDLPLLLNKSSFYRAKRMNKNSQLMSAFFPRIEHDENLDKDIKKGIEKLKENCNTVFCTNAFDLAFDKNGKEIYSISVLVRLFKDLPDSGLVISDPTGRNLAYLGGQKLTLGKNIYFITKPHIFELVINSTDAFIRATTTDGDSLSVKEALYLKKPVIASDCVERPEGCILFSINDLSELKNILENQIQSTGGIEIPNNPIHDYIQLYNALISP